MPTDLGKKMLREVAKRGYTGASREVFFKEFRGIGYPRLEAEVLALEREGYITIEWVGPNDFTVSITRKGVDTLDPEDRKDWFEKTKGEVPPEEFGAGFETPYQAETEGQAVEEQPPSDTQSENEEPQYEEPQQEQYYSSPDMPAEDITTPPEETEPEQQGYGQEEPEQEETEQQGYGQEEPEQEETEQQGYGQEEPEQEEPEQEEYEQQEPETEYVTEESSEERPIPPPPEDEEDKSVKDSSKEKNDGSESKPSPKMDFGIEISVEKTLDEMIREELESALKSVEEAIRSQDEELRGKSSVVSESNESFSVCLWNDKRVCRLARIKEVAGRYDLLPLYCIACKLNEKE